jgi:hypothetical protein
MKLGDVDRAAELPGRFLQHEADHGICAAECLKRAKSQPETLVLHVGRGDAEFRRESG